MHIMHSLDTFMHERWLARLLRRCAKSSRRLDEDRSEFSNSGWSLRGCPAMQFAIRCWTTASARYDNRPASLSAWQAGSLKNDWCRRGICFCTYNRIPNSNRRRNRPPTPESSSLLLFSRFQLHPQTGCIRSERLFVRNPFRAAAFLIN